MLFWLYSHVVVVCHPRPREVMEATPILIYLQNSQLNHRWLESLKHIFFLKISYHYGILSTTVSFWTLRMPYFIFAGPLFYIVMMFNVIHEFF